MSYLFYDCKSLIKTEFISIDTSKVNDMSYMFCNCTNLEYIDLSNFDTSNVENMEGMFSGCSKLKEIKGINNFKIKNVNIKRIFDDCNKLDYLIISNDKILDIKKLILKNQNSISVMFFISAQNIHYPVACNESDPFSKIELKLFEEFPELKTKNIYYLANENTVNKTITLKENKIKNGDTILLNYIENDN